MAHLVESRRSEAARPRPTTTRIADPDTLQLSVAPEAPPAGTLTLATAAAPPLAQTNGQQPNVIDYDPADYRWVPVRRKPRFDGWTEEKQRRFIETLADTGLMGVAAKEVGMSG